MSKIIGFTNRNKTIIFQNYRVGRKFVRTYVIIATNK